MTGDRNTPNESPLVYSGLSEKVRRIGGERSERKPSRSARLPISRVTTRMRGPGNPGPRRPNGFQCPEFHLGQLSPLAGGEVGERDRADGDSDQP